MKTKWQFAMLLAVVLVPVISFAQNQSSGPDAFSQRILDSCKWGAPSTNGIKLGVKSYHSSDSKELCVQAFLYNETDATRRIMSPPDGYGLSISVKAADGKAVDKTKEGESIIKPVGYMAMVQMKRRVGRTQGAWDSVVSKMPNRFERPINVLDCFDVEPGTNILTLRANVYSIGKYNSLSELVVPPVSIPVVITQADLDAHRASKEKTPSK